jgi:metal-responsive CopG/Arc/MetJ family transcriptional regulator
VTEKQVLFRIDAKLLDALDRRLEREGYTTRNAWFKDAVAGYAGRAKAKKARR